jgi:large subunit ribosomal protein L4
MKSIAVYNLSGEKVKDIKLADTVWNVEINESVVKDAVVLQMASLRQGTAKTKTRAEVSGGGKKPWRQKGTGRARQGSTRAPQWIHGGISFGPVPRSYDKKQNKKERVLAIKSLLSLKNKEKNLIVLENFDLKDNKTKTFNDILKKFNATNETLIVVSDDNNNLYLATRNNNKVVVIPSTGLNVLDLMKTNKLILDEKSIEKIEEVLK